jgi:hypothetical protein
VKTDVDIEELQSTKGEKLLAVVLAAFFLIGAVWAYQRIDEAVRDAVPLRNATAGETAALEKRSAAQERLFRATNASGRARNELELRRERYRTALEAKEPAQRLRAAYTTANRAYEQAVRARRQASAALAAATPAANAAQRRLDADAGARRDRQELVVFVARLALVVVLLLGAYWWLARLRERGSRYLPLGAASVGATTVLAFVLAVDYLTDYFDPLDLGILFLALLGALTTIAAFWVLQRYLARRLPARRARRHECPFCGYPVRRNVHCEGCGRRVVGECSTCGAARRVGTPHCGACGAA